MHQHFLLCRLSLAKAVGLPCVHKAQDLWPGLPTSLLLGLDIKLPQGGAVCPTQLLAGGAKPFLCLLTPSSPRISVTGGQKHLSREREEPQNCTGCALMRQGPCRRHSDHVRCCLSSTVRGPRMERGCTEGRACGSTSLTCEAASHLLTDVKQ